MVERIQPIKICLYAIAKNEEHNVDNFVSAAKLFDDCVVLDTGSTDRTVELLRQQGIKVYEKSYAEFDFSQARNDAMALVPEDCTWLFSLDFNERLSVTAEQIEAIRTSQVDGLEISCYDSVDVNYFERKLKIHRKDTYKWKYAIHEYLDNQVPKSEPSDITVTKYLQNVEQKNGFYREICEREHRKNPNEPHYCWWAMTVYKDYDLERYRYFGEQYLNTSKPYTTDFRVYAFISLSEIYRTSDIERSMDYAIHAVSESLVLKRITSAPIKAALTHLNSLGLQIVQYKDTRE